MKRPPDVRHLAQFIANRDSGSNAVAVGAYAKRRNRGFILPAMGLFFGLTAKIREAQKHARKDRAMAGLDDEIAAFNAIKETLEASHRGEWAVVHGRALIGTFQSFQQAANLAIKSFGRGPYLIRQIGVPPVPLPVSVLYSMPHGPG
jgi:hypothetical protein